MNRSRARTWLFAGSIAFAFLLQLMPLPQTLLPLKPYWVGLVLVYWAIETPERTGLGFAFFVGLAGDLVSGEILAEQALRLVVMIFIVLRFRARLRFFPMWQQALAVLALLLNDRIVVVMIRGFAGDLDVGMARQPAAQLVARGCFVVDDEHAHHARNTS